MKKRLLSLGAILIGLGLLFNLSRSLYQTHQASLHLKNLEDEVLAQQQRQKELEEVLAERQGLEYVEEQARGQLYMTKEGEQLVVIPEEAQSSKLKAQNSAAHEKKPHAKSNYLLWQELFFGN